jgi:TPR repeat protein
MFVIFNAEQALHQMPAARRAPKTKPISFYERGLACSSSVESFDLIEAHKWFNLAAMAGDERGHAARVEIGLDMTQREIAEAQRRARAIGVARTH